MKRKILSILLVCILMISLTGCGNSDSPKLESNKKNNTDSAEVNSSGDSNDNSGIINVGDITIKYGTYNGFEIDRGTKESKPISNKLVLKKNGKCEYDGEDCSYTITKFDFGDNIERECIKILVEESYGNYDYYYYPSNSDTLTDNFAYEFKYSEK